MLSGVNVALGITGSIAAVKTVEIAHELRRRGANVRGVMSESARGIVHPWSVEFATDEEVVTEITGRVEHVDLCGWEGWADVLLIAPATANTVGKIAGAIDDTPVTTCATTALGADLPVVIAPAMHEPMYDHPGVLDSIERVEGWGVEFVSPRIEEGKAKIAAADAIALATARAATPSALAGEHVVVTAGATAESVDPVRVLTNRSSGKTGRAVARACYVAGADVTLIHALVGPHPVTAGEEADPATYAEFVSVESSAELSEAALAAAADADAYVSVAAISDYTVEPEEEKIRSGEDVSLDLLPSPKVVDAVREANPDLPIVGFKTETGGDDDAMVEAARAIAERVGMSFVVANDASVMGAEETRTLFVDGEVTERVGTKAEIGEAVAAELGDRIGGTATRHEE
ncbi:bifunctional phosphopantothenoylcysteine decarboxylase/phosphopantothenate--cysteine ligase CoaBC [Halalkalicoccus sp. NIPERK01]|uniref:bifunctional phosphopantothenoylcysteine decarboxylase/phosphopantothenate--cysteine ligase CoaBC n=1 Tax=Halalkalicoccus sp. NIPERK01 TaxID=3053469 RepID=UPI00256EEBA5|nr:bifunctional phosphopantothenoylcysteine decarboxylase/phosphopantothenate--cysteine ligase CoaBC [Halalkalicoccus sp. NIPERK01]MDL5363738.1 bifunctional phosphopantothenoylcysteine decarboxylase/phosphopantothenate--cysteine ligase CoaBC [Halalkalicoccus sp. NIPERK01]